MLSDAGYDNDKITFLHQGFTRGFDLSYEGPKQRQSRSQNIPFTVGNEIILWNKIMKEVQANRVAGPYKSIPFDNFIQSPIGLVPKVGGDGTRLIFHLSYDFKKEDLKSVNFFTPKEKCSVQYRNLDFAVKTFLDLICQDEKEAETDAKDNADKRKNLKTKWRSKFSHHKRMTDKVIYSGKSDLWSAFCILGLLPLC